MTYSTLVDNIPRNARLKLSFTSVAVHDLSHSKRL